MCALTHTVLHVEFPAVLLNMHGECACRAIGGIAFLIAYSVLCLTYTAVHYSLISTRRLDRMRCIKMAAYWLNVIFHLLSQYVTLQSSFFLDEYG